MHSLSGHPFRSLEPTWKVVNSMPVLGCFIEDLEVAIDCLAAAVT